MPAKHYMITALSFLIAKFTFGDVASTSYGITNGTITLKANIRGVLEEILWKWNDNKVVEVDKNSRDEYGRFAGRTVVNFTTGDLTITALTEGDSGNYQAEAQVAGKLQHSYHRVEIIDPVTEPIVTCETSGKTLTLVCAADLNPLTEYSWEGPEGPMLLSGSELQLDSGESPDTVYTCVVKNPATERRGSITIHHCFTAAGAVIINLAIALGVLSVLLVVVIGIYIYCKKRSEGTERETNDLTEQEDTSNGGLLLAPPPEQQGVGEEQGVLGDEDRPGDEEDPSHSRQESPI
ncbi:hypothetical protein SKAU_G00260450 [Synaphobranchus kaupii]|uniref:Ig-like domain-containing protein n=1 Tax=Synaphobranchus kaupii TaxID=118154 RepID=A0A9Q1ISR9_SYNKA|nr:hypothetical protein SKAU_G00260450 [Synaphobranchus kaupii]